MNDYVTKNYFTDGGDTLVIGGKLVAAVISLLRQSMILGPCASAPGSISRPAVRFLSAMRLLPFMEE